MNKNFLISVIIPVYNTEKYLEETIKSVTGQTIGFEENIQIILVNDGSTDGSDAICKCYAQKYQENIIYCDLGANHGVSYARNRGKELATGKYINFFDSDDLWTPDAFRRAVDFLEEHFAEVDLVSVDIENFEAYGGGHILNHNWETDTIIDTNIQYNKIRSIASTCIIKREVALDYEFNEKQKYWEDTAYINGIMMRKQRYGMLSKEVKYLYRRRVAKDSVSQSYGKTKKYFFEDSLLFYEGIYGASMKQCGEFLSMAQYVLAYAVGYRFMERITILNEEELAAYKEILLTMLRPIEDKYIWENCNTDEFTKRLMVAFKHGVDFREEMTEWKMYRSQIGPLQRKLEKTEKNYAVLRKWFELKSSHQSVLPYLQKNNYQKVAIYGFSDMGRYLLDELKESGVEVAYVIEKRDVLIEDGTLMVKPDAKLTEVDAILVTAPFFYEEIKDMLSKKVACPIISLETMFDEIGRLSGCFQ